MPDEALVRYFEDRAKGKPDALPDDYDGAWTDYMTAGAAMVARRTKVTITSRSTEGATTGGEVTGDPREICAALQALFDKVLGTPNADGPEHGDFSYSPCKMG